MLDLTAPTEVKFSDQLAHKKQVITIEKFYYDNQVVKMFIYATVFWGVVGMLAGLLASIQLF